MRFEFFSTEGSLCGKNVRNSRISSKGQGMGDVLHYYEIYIVHSNNSIQSDFLSSASSFPKNRKLDRYNTLSNCII